MTKRLRIAQVQVQPILMWDDGEELTPGPPVQAQGFTLAQLPAFIEELPEQVAALARKVLEAVEPSSDDTPDTHA